MSEDLGGQGEDAADAMEDAADEAEEEEDSDNNMYVDREAVEVDESEAAAEDVPAEEDITSQSLHDR